MKSWDYFSFRPARCRLSENTPQNILVLLRGRTACFGFASWNSHSPKPTSKNVNIDGLFQKSWHCYDKTQSSYDRWQGGSLPAVMGRREVDVNRLPELHFSLAVPLVIITGLDTYKSATVSTVQP